MMQANVGRPEPLLWVASTARIRVSRPPDPAFLPGFCESHFLESGTCLLEIRLE